MAQETLEKTFNISGSARLNLSNIRGAVEIRPGEAGVVQITAIKHADSGDARSTEIELTQSANGTVIAATHFPDGWWLWLLGSMPCKVDYVVKMPQNAAIKLNGVSNKVFVDGLTGDFDINTVSGDVTVQNLTGPLKVKSVSGKVSASRCSNRLELSTVSGDVDFRKSQLSAVQARTTSGELDFEIALQNGPYRFDSVSGNLNLSIPAGTRCSLQLQSISGRMRGNYPTTTHSFGHGSQVVDVLGGGVLVAAHSVSGDLQLMVAENLQAVPAVNRREILEQLERGEINADQALTGLKG
jgi:hypothetical protein